MMRRRALLLAGLLLAGLVATAAPASAASGARPSPSDRALIAAGLVARGDVPASWVGSHQSNDIREFSKIAACRAVYVALLAANRRVPNALSRQFADPTSNGQTLASDQVFAFRTVKAASAYLAAFEGPNAGPCLQMAIQQVVVGGGVNNTAATVGTPAGLDGIGDAATGQQVTVSVAASGTSLTLVVDFDAVRIGRTVIGFDFLNANHPLPQALPIIGAAVARVQHAG
jgi:1-aminocyclopropane-1-carboxylate deaminase/D-cysteine desulfhydrase-like pyridoxal-dependent ACC family enzyme